jgi:hypothetical protein
LSLAVLTAGCGGSTPTPTTAAGGKAADWIRLERLPPAARPGALLFSSSGCTACHTYLGDGRSNLGAPDLTSIGAKNLGVAYYVRFLRCPSCLRSGSTMPAFDSLGAARLRRLAVFLEASKGRR